MPSPLVGQDAGSRLQTAVRRPSAPGAPRKPRLLPPLGMIGAWVCFWRRADNNAERALGVAKGLMWPAFLVYEAFSAVSGPPRR